MTKTPATPNSEVMKSLDEVADDQTNKVPLPKFNTVKSLMNDLEQENPQK
ncbi:hypothetical protein [Companilactobacillus suantsaicola]|nr:hypothetical protein [Companilactobacillus suantsaicola]